MSFDAWLPTDTSTGQVVEFVATAQADETGTVDWLEGINPIATREEGTLGSVMSLHIVGSSVTFHCAEAAQNVYVRLTLWPREIVATPTTGGLAPGSWTGIDLDPPVMTVFQVAAVQPSRTIPIYLGPTASGDPTGYAITVDTTDVPLLSAFGEAPTSVTVATDGVHTLRCYARDAAGNISLPGPNFSAGCTVDSMPPTLNTFTVEATSTDFSVAVTALTASADTVEWFLSEMPHYQAHRHGSALSLQASTLAARVPALSIAGFVISPVTYRTA